MPVDQSFGGLHAGAAIMDRVLQLALPAQPAPRQHLAAD
jgi:hypothetical protein